MVSKARKQLRSKTKDRVDAILDRSDELTADNFRKVLFAEMEGSLADKGLAIKDGFKHFGAVGLGLGAGALTSRLLKEEPSDEDLLMKFDNIESQSINQKSKGDEGYEY